MWGAYHVHHSSADFHQKWVDFVYQAISRTPSPIFYQYVTNEIFKRLVKVKYTHSTRSTGTSLHLTREEENALRYVAGHVVKKWLSLSNIMRIVLFINVEFTTLLPIPFL